MEPIVGVPLPQKQGGIFKKIGSFFGRKVSQIPEGTKKSDGVSHVGKAILGADQAAAMLQPVIAEERLNPKKQPQDYVSDMEKAFGTTSRDDPYSLFDKNGNLLISIWKNHFGGFSVQVPGNDLFSISKDGKTVFLGDKKKYPVTSMEGDIIRGQILLNVSLALMKKETEPLLNAFWNTDRDNPFEFMSQLGKCYIWKNQYGGFSIQIPGKNLLSLSDDGRLIFDGPSSHKVDYEDGRRFLNTFLSMSAQALKEKGPGIQEQARQKIEQLQDIFSDTSEIAPFSFEHEGKKHLIWGNEYEGFTIQYPDGSRTSLSKDGSKFYSDLNDSIKTHISGPMYDAREYGKEFFAAAEAAIKAKDPDYF